MVHGTVHFLLREFDLSVQGSLVGLSGREFLYSLGHCGSCISNARANLCHRRQWLDLCGRSLGRSPRAALPVGGGASGARVVVCGHLLGDGGQLFLHLPQLGLRGGRCGLQGLALVLHLCGVEALPVPRGAFVLQLVGEVCNRIVQGVDFFLSRLLGRHSDGQQTYTEDLRESRHASLLSVNTCCSAVGRRAARGKMRANSKKCERGWKRGSLQGRSKGWVDEDRRRWTGTGTEWESDACSLG
mmetsp:Transcript_98595/g.205562  ORF Transcript_98595/g.205562 Transcript_98595/m.205562 type:complete len:243 (-) Transcript_98595:9-737(-)